MSLLRRYVIEAHGLDAHGNETNIVTPIGFRFFRRSAEKFVSQYKPLEPIPGKPLYEMRIHR